jgi:hypothetical protein
MTSERNMSAQWVRCSRWYIFIEYAAKIGTETMCVKDPARAARDVLTKESWPMRGLVSWTN